MNKEKKEIEKILGKYKVIGDTTYGLGYKETEELCSELMIFMDSYANKKLEESKEKIEKVKQVVQKSYGTYKYDSCYDDCISIISSLTNKQ